MGASRQWRRWEAGRFARGRGTVRFGPLWGGAGAPGGPGRAPQSNHQGRYALFTKVHFQRSEEVCTIPPSRTIGGCIPGECLLLILPPVQPPPPPVRVARVWALQRVLVCTPPPAGRRHERPPPPGRACGHPNRQGGQVCTVAPRRHAAAGARPPSAADWRTYVRWPRGRCAAGPSVRGRRFAHLPLSARPWRPISRFACRAYPAQAAYPACADAHGQRRLGPV